MRVCVLQIFEWWYFRKYGTSFIEQVSVSHLRPLLGGVDNSAPSAANAANGEADSSRQSVSGERRAAPRRAVPGGSGVSPKIKYKTAALIAHPDPFFSNQSAVCCTVTSTSSCLL